MFQIDRLLFFVFVPLASSRLFQLILTDLTYRKTLHTFLKFKLTKLFALKSKYLSFPSNNRDRDESSSQLKSDSAILS